jgi:hypothetical protein
MTVLEDNLRLSQAALRLLARGPRLRVLREALVAAGESWLVEFLPQRFQRAYAQTLGYVTSQRRDPWAARRNLPPTYDARKRAYQGHDDPLVWTGRLRELIYRQARVTASGVRGTADTVRARVTFGRLAVGQPGAWTQPPPLVRQTLVGRAGLPPHETEAVASAFQAEVVARLQDMAPGARRLPPPPPVQADRRAERAAARTAQATAAGRARGQVYGRALARQVAREARENRWRSDSGGAAPLGIEARSAAERRQAHRLTARASYHRNREAILLRRRQRYRQANP